MTDRRDEIADIFMKYFHHYGFKKTPVDDVAADLHISKKTIYEYFDSKEDVFSYIIQRESSRIGIQISSQLKTVSGNQEKVRVLIHLIFENATAYINKSKTLDFHNQDEIASRAFQSAYEAILKSVIEEGKRSGEFSTAFSDLDLKFVNAVIMQSMLTLREDPLSQPENSTCKMVLKMLT